LGVHAFTHRGEGDDAIAMPSMRAFAEVCDAVAATPKRLEKVERVRAYVVERPIEEGQVAARFFSGSVFAAWEQETLQVGGALVRRVVEAVLARRVGGDVSAELTAAYRRRGDFGDATADVLAAHASATDATEDPSVSALDAALRRAARASKPAAKGAILESILERASPRVASYTLKIIAGDLRIGLKEALVEEAIAKAFGATLAEVARANLLVGDVGEALVLASRGELAGARMRMFHPLGVMLAAAAGSAQEAFCAFEEAVVEDKLDGIRAQVHVSEAEGRARIFSRTRDDVTASFPELEPAVRGLPGELVLDGEVLAYREGEGALPFAELQKRLGRKVVDDETMRALPVAFVAFDVLVQDGALVIDEPLSARCARLDAIFAARREPAVLARAGQMSLFGAAPPRGLALRSITMRASSPADLEALFDAAQARGNEGLMIKDARSPYTPGRRGKTWLKLKRELATLDCVVTAVELGHGRRAGVLSDYTFAVRDEGRLVDIGKAYTGLTDAEIASYTRYFTERTLVDQGFRRVVEPTLVVEIAFNAIMRSDRHASGFALRFPRIVRVRDDKLPADASTLDDARAVFARQGPRREPVA
jgi:DNA ligase-1